MPKRRTRSAAAAAAATAASAADAKSAGAEGHDDATLASASASEREGSEFCWVCLEQGSTSHELLRSCACRGHSGWAHRDCLVKAAQANSRCWTQCPTCKQRWTGKLYLQMAREWSLAVASRAARPGIRELVDMNLSVALRLNGRLAESIRIGREVVATCHRRFGDTNAITVSVVTDLASTHIELGDPTSALPLYIRALAGSRLLYGNDHRITLAAVGNLAGAYRDMGNMEKAIPLYQEDLAASRRLLSADDPDLLTSINNMGAVHQELGKLDSGLTLLQESLDGCQRVLGHEHPDTLQTLGMVGRVHCKKGDFDAGGLLFEKVSVGFSGLYSEAHVLVSYYRRCAKCAAQRVVPQSLKEFRAEQETMYERRAKRPRNGQR